MTSLARFLFIPLVLFMTISCKDVAFRSGSSSSTGLNCTGPECPDGAHSWFEGGFDICSKPCGGGSQTQIVECRRNSDDVAVVDSFCSGTKPVGGRTCNAQTCTGSYNWNVGSFGTCSKTCGTGERTRPVLCQDSTGATVADTFCAATPKPAVNDPCNTNTCPPISYYWNVTPGACSKQCGGGTATDVVVCKRSDGVTVPDSNCSANPKPFTSRVCNPDACTANYTYAWAPGAFSACSKPCDYGVQTRSVICKRNDGMYVAENYCPLPKPANWQACKVKDCSAGRRITQTATVTPALNMVDVILIIDDSGSMKADQVKLASRLAGLMTDLDSLNIDYQVCLTSTDIYHYKGSPIKWKGPNSYIINKYTPNKNQAFVDTINAIGSEWSSDEQGIKSAYLMFKDYLGAGCVRNDSTLTTILISDENERSVGGNQAWSSQQYKPLTPENYPDTLISFVKTTFGPAKKFIWNSIIVKPGDKVCEALQDTQSSVAFFGTLYAELSNKTGGHVGSICDNDYAQNLQYIKQRTVNNLPGLTMECVPIGTPNVTFDRPVATSITVTGNMIRFSPALSEGVKITATYTCP